MATSTSTSIPRKRRAPRAETRHIAAMLSSASESDLAQGMTWYARAEAVAVKLAHTYGITFHQAVGVIAALSPNNKWKRNCADAANLIRAYVRGHDPATVKVSTFHPNKRKALSILQSPTQELISQILLGKDGRKVQAFFLSITGRHDAVCVDGHAYAIWKGQRIPTTKTPKLGARLYATIARAYCLVADRSESLCGVKLTPAQVQAVTWVTYRRQLLGWVDSDDLI